MTDLFDDLMILIPGLVSCAGRHAPFDLELDAGALCFSCDVDRAGREREDMFDHFQGFPESVGRCIGPIIERAVFLHPADNRQAREIIFDGQSHIGILFVVAKTTLNRGVPLDQVAFQDQCFEFLNG